MTSQEKEEKRKPKASKTGKVEVSPFKEAASAKGQLLKNVKEDVLWHKRTVLLIVSILTAVILSPRLTTSVYRYHPGDIARQNVKAGEDTLVEDRVSTLKKQEEAVAASLSVYDLDEEASLEIRKRIEGSFDSMRNYLAEAEAKAKAGTYAAEIVTDKILSNKSHMAGEIRSAYLEESREERFSAFKEKLGTTLSENGFGILEVNKFNKNLENILKEAVLPVMKGGVLDSKALLLREKDKGIIVRSVKTQVERTITDISGFIDMEEAKENVSKNIYSYGSGVDRKSKKILAGVASLLIRPNLTFNKNETENRKNMVSEEVNAVFFQIKEGEMVLREGERVTAEHILRLEALTAQSKIEMKYLKLLGLTLLVALILYAVYHFSAENIRKISLDTGDMTFLGILFVVILAAGRLSIPFTEALSNAFPFIPASSCQYIFTAAAGAMLVRIVLNSEAAILFSIVISLMAAIIMKDSLVFGIYTFIGCVVGAHMVRYCKTRSSLIKAGFYVGLANMTIVLIFDMAYGNLSGETTLFNMLLGFIGGILSGIIVTGVIPIIEGLFGYTTNFNLLELASLDHPLLKELITQAPGTYHHSWIIGNLVENAAEAINANPLFARVSALYHDIGKMKKPQYFFENKKGGKNPHDKLTPSLSSLIIIGHVKDGIELAREYKLGKRLIDIIPQHHGTKLISYFYNKAKEKEDPEVHTVDEKDFRYPGPKPQTKEAGLVMLADAVEAASRTVQDPTPARIKAVVKKIIGDIFLDGQLDECELTLKDLNSISESFERVLNGIFHSRIDYPEPVIKEGEEKKNEGTDRVKKESGGSKAERPRKSGKENPGTATLQ